MLAQKQPTSAHTHTHNQSSRRTKAQSAAAANDGLQFRVVRFIRSFRFVLFQATATTTAESKAAAAASSKQHIAICKAARRSETTFYFASRSLSFFASLSLSAYLFLFAPPANSVETKRKRKRAHGKASSKLTNERPRRLPSTQGWRLPSQTNAARPTPETRTSKAEQSCSYCFLLHHCSTVMLLLVTAICVPSHARAPLPSPVQRAASH